MSLSLTSDLWTPPTAHSPQVRGRDSPARQSVSNAGNRGNQQLYGWPASPVKLLKYLSGLIPLNLSSLWAGLEGAWSLTFGTQWPHSLLLNEASVLRLL